MGNSIKTDNVVLLFDVYNQDSQNLHTSFQLSGKEHLTAVIDDDGFLPEGVISIYGYFLGEFVCSDKVPGKPRYFNQIPVPQYWEISASNSSGKIHNLHKERGRIFYAEPKHKRLVKVVDWYDENGVVRSSDHYTKYGALYARTIFNHKGQRVNRSYFDTNGKEVIVENFVTKSIILNEENIVRIFPSKLDFIVYFFEKAGLTQYRIFFNTLSTSFFVSQRLGGNEKGDVLFWQEPKRDDIPGNMQVILNGQATRVGEIMVQKKDAYEKLISLGASTEIVKSLGYIYPFKKENQHKAEALICTNSDRIAHIEKLVEAMPEMHFTIAAITEMSSKLMSMDKYENVSLYPGVKMHVLDELFQNCDFYLDINHESEIVSAVQQAFLHNQLIFGFRETLHNLSYIAEKHIYEMENVNQMIADLKSCYLDKAIMDAHIKIQHEAAMLECAETYKGI